MTSNPLRAGHVACGRCLYYRVTWDTALPFGCAAHKFKSARNPALAVYQSSGLQCQLFRQRAEGGAPPPPHRQIVR
jgi:hypothetical protein